MKQDLPYTVQRRLYQLGIDFLEAWDSTIECLNLRDKFYSFNMSIHSGGNHCCISGFEQMKGRHPVCIYSVMNEEYDLYQDRSFLFSSEWADDPLEAMARLKCYLSSDKKAIEIGYDFLMGHTLEEPKFLLKQDQKSLLEWFKYNLDLFDQQVKIEKGVVKVRI